MAALSSYCFGVSVSAAAGAAPGLDLATWFPFQRFRFHLPSMAWANRKISSAH
jgi:hypothetical protein